LIKDRASKKEATPLKKPSKKEATPLKKSSKKEATPLKKPKEATSLKKSSKKGSEPISNSASIYCANFINTYKNLYLKFNTNVDIQNYFNNSENDKNYLYSNAFNRMHTFFTFGYCINFDIVNTITATFKIKDMSSNIESIFAFGYYEILKPESLKLHINKSLILGSNISVRYFSIGGSYISKDGEYRSNIISTNNFQYITDTPALNKIFTDITVYLSEVLTQRKYIIYREYFFPTDVQKSIEPTLEYQSYRTGIGLFSLAWLNLMINLDLNIIENNLNEKYQNIMLKYKDDDLAYYRNLKKNYSTNDIDELRNLISNIKQCSSNKTLGDTKIGQKIIPLSISEAQNPFNIRYSPWREYLISLHLSDLVVNYVSPGFFITNEWFYIKNARKGLFDNDIQYEKMHRSELAEQITNLLIRADYYTHENIDAKNKKSKYIKNTNKLTDSWITNKFKILSKKIQDPIQYAKEEIIMSNVALVFISEYVGRTILDVISLCKSSPYYNKLVGEPFTLDGYPLFTKYMFDICYNLYCMNSISGLIHGDLHLNNATLKASSYKHIRNIKDIQNPTVLYVLGDLETEQFILPTVIYNICIIDYSRSIILPDKINQFHDKSLPKSYQLLSNAKEFQLEQVERLLAIYIHFTSDSDYNIDDLRVMFKNKFEAVFKLITSADIYSFTQKLITIFNLNDKSIVAPHKLCMELLKKINKASEHFLTVEMNKLILDGNYEKTILEMEWPLFTIIKSCFYEKNILHNKSGNIIEVFNINNKLTYSLTKLDTFPDLITKNIIVDKKIVKDYSKLISFRKLHESKKNNGMKIINYIANRQKTKHL
jgi:hypothetical protein